jgi:uncharacterized membrane protein YozB (DUF420 family)
MQLRLDWKYVAAFFALNGVVSELHEQAHITTGRLMHGCYGSRDFNNWQECAASALPLASMAGPLFSYIVMWLGAWLVARAATPGNRALGFALVFAPLPFARVFTVLMKGGDERIFLTALTGDVLPPGALRAVVIAFTLLFCAPPVWFAWRALGNRHRGWIVAAFCVVPLLVIWAYKLKLLNGLLQQGVLATPVILGTPAFVLLVFALMLLATALTWRWLRVPQA